MKQYHARCNVALQFLNTNSHHFVQQVYDSDQTIVISWLQVVVVAALQLQSDHQKTDELFTYLLIYSTHRTNTSTNALIYKFGEFLQSLGLMLGDWYLQA